jgi:hypothetical protein
MRVLVKIASRSRPDSLKWVMLAYEKLWSHNGRTGFLISADEDDVAMRDFKNPTKMPCAIVYSHSRSKIDAINRDVAHPDWDILVVGSDDSIPKTEGWDNKIRHEFIKNFPDFDGLLWPKDGFNNRIVCFPIIGRKYYERFGYIYHPSYQSLYCDDEQTLVAKRLGKLKQSDSVVFDHLHYRNKKRKRDALDARNEAHMNSDYDNYKKRLFANFP